MQATYALPPSRCVVLVLLTLAAPAAAQERPVLRAVRVEEPPTIDGRLDEPAWGRAPAATGFTQFQPNPGAPATERTEVRILYDDGAIYVGARLYDTSPDSIVGRLARRDEDPYSDWFRVGFDSYLDRRTAFVFGVNPRGVRQDLFVFNDTDVDDSWDPVWAAAAQADSLGWSVEILVPLSQLRFNPASGATNGAGELVWGVQFQREIARRDEESFWAPTTPEREAIVSVFGDLHGLAGLDAPRRIELLPYSLGELTRAPGDAANPFYRRNAVFGSLGADVKYGLTSDLTLTAALNPDFGQVEADPSVVNLTAFETFFPEKRPFFVEGVDIFRFRVSPGDGGGEQLFYSRRIGRRPQGSAPGGAAYAAIPDATTILGAAKLSGKTAGGWSVGLLEAVTAPEYAPYVDGAGERAETLVEPLTNYGVLRVSKDFRAGQSAVGGIVTTTHRRLDGELQFLRSAAYAGGADARHRFAGGNYELRGWVLGSRIEGGADAIARVQRAPGHYFQRPDAGHLTLDTTRTALAGVAADVLFLKIGGGHWRGGAGAHVRSPGFEVNDLGFQQSADFAIVGAGISYEQFRPGPLFRRWSANLNPWSVWTLGGERSETAASLNFNYQLNNFWGGWLGMQRNLPALSPAALRGGPAIATAGRTRTWFGVYSDNRRALSGDVGGSVSREDETGGWSASVDPGLDLRVGGRIQLGLDPFLRWNRNPWQYVAAPSDVAGTHYVFGELRQTTGGLTVRASYTFTPDLSLQIYAQPFLSAGDFVGFREVADPRARRFADRFSALGGPALAFNESTGRYEVDPDGDGAVDYTFRNPDFNVRQLRSNVVLRWEYRPGSTLFVVWSHGRTSSDQDADFMPGRDLGRLFRAEGTHVLLVKASYWFGL